MKYRNTKTGAVIDVASKIRGGNWVLVGGEKSPKKETVTADIPNVTVEEVKPVKKAAIKKPTLKKATKTTKK